MHISGKFQENSKTGLYNIKADIRSEKTSIKDTKADIRDEKADIRIRIEQMSADVSEKTISHVMILFEKYGNEQIFGRSCVEEVTGLKSSRASELLKLLLNCQIIEPVKGHGKGKYHFS